MDTRWKNTANKIKSFWKKNKVFLLGGLLAAVGILLLGYAFYRNRFYMSTENVWKLGITANLFIAFSICLTVPKALDRIYGGWLPENSDFYHSWKEVCKKLNGRICLAGGIMLGLAVLFLNTQIRGGYFYPNYAMGYMLVATAAVQLMTAEICLFKFMRGRLDMLFDCVNEVNKERLREAVELEKKSIEKAAKSEQLKVDLISNVSHDLKTPLTSMVGYLELLKKEELGDVPRDYVEVISDKAEKLKEMIESLFSLAKASSGNIKTHMELIEMNRLIEQLFADMEDKVADSGLHFVKSLTEEDTHIITDNMHMYRICQNLVENALKYSAKGTRVFVKTFTDEILSGRRLCLEITNTAGYLMDFDKTEIVERFARGDKARSSEGNGLGLAIVSTYAGALGGSFDINIDCDQFKAVLYFPLPKAQGTEEKDEKQYN